MSHPAPHPTPPAIEPPGLSAAWAALADIMDGDLHRGSALRQIYATDASEYQEQPAAVAVPASEADLGRLLAFARRHHVGLIVRGTGTSLAGQVVGPGIVVDVSRHLNHVLSYDHARHTVRVQPGVVRNELNRVLAPHDVWFGPETATANRATIGGMVGNNSCGANSIVYGATRDHLVSARGFLSDGSPATFGPLTAAEFAAKCAGPDTLENRVYRFVRELLADANNRQLIRDNFPKAAVTRRNTGYALDALMDCGVFEPASPKPFNLCRLIAGSEGTLFLGVEFELNCEPLPPPGALLCAHFHSVDDALKATLIAMQRQPFACELIDRLILDCTKDSLVHGPNRFFVQGDPAAVLVVEIRHADPAHLEREFAALIADLRAAGLGYAFPLVWGPDCERVWHLRRAGQGLLQNVPGDAKPREVVEDTAVAVEDLPAYIAEFAALLRNKYGVSSTYYAHAGAGELHTRPLFNLKTKEGLRMFRGIATDVAALVKKYRGSLSGEHGDGRLRGEFIPFMVGPECYAMMRRVKETFDPLGLLNPGKIIDTPPMDTSLRHGPGLPTPEYGTIFDFSATHGVLRTTEQCNGNGECRKSHLTGGTMCPSYMATRNEQDTTRARANLLRQVLTHPADATNPWDSEEIKGVMDLCLSCKGCKSECPSNVDVARLKAEWQQHYHDTHGVPLRSRLIAGFAQTMRFAAHAPRFYNWLVTAPDTSRWIKQFSGFAAGRSLPKLHATTLAAWHAKHANKISFTSLVGSELAHAGLSATQARESLHDLKQHTPALRATPLDRGDSSLRSRSPLYEEGCPKGGVCGSPPTPPFPHGRVYLFCDEFTNYSDTTVGIKAVELLNRLGYEVIIPNHVESGRAQLSKGLVRDAQALAIRNVELLKDIVSADTPLIGLEPSAILGFRDEFPDLVPAHLKGAAQSLAKHALLFEEFIAREAAAGRIRRESFRAGKKLIRLHGHCHQKALSSLNPSVAALELPAGYEVRLIASGCCGMAGSFGYETEHFALSQQIGELVLFPAVRAAASDTILCAPGTSCRHQIKDATGRMALHPAEILHAALA